MEKEFTPSVQLNSFLSKAKQEQIKLAVATSSPRYRAELFLGKLNLLTSFDSIVGYEQVKRHKPYPDIFIEAAKTLAVSNRDCVAIEDAASGIAAAKAAGMKAVGLVTAFHSLVELKRSDLVIEKLADLDLEKLRQLF